MNICVIVPENNVYSETFIRAHIDRLPGKVTSLHGGFLPTHTANGELLLLPERFLERARRSLLKRLFRFDFSHETLKNKALYKYLTNNKIDVVLAEYGPTGAHVMDVCLKAGISLVVHFHGYDAYQLDILQEYGKQYLILFQIADAVVVVSKHMEKHIVGLGAPKEKVHYNPCGMNAEIFYGSNPAKAPPVFVAAGRFVDKKAPHLTLLAFAKVFAEIPEVKLIMAGKGPLLNACISMAKSLGIEGSVIFPGPQTPQQVAQLMRLARAFVQHSIIPASGDSEGTPVTVQEAGGSGLPVISTYHGGIPDVVQEGITGFLVNEYDSDAMAERMLRIARDPQLAGQMGKAAQQRILSEFTLDKSITRLINIIEIAAKGKNKVK